MKYQIERKNRGWGDVKLVKGLKMKYTWKKSEEKAILVVKESYIKYPDWEISNGSK